MDVSPTIANLNLPSTAGNYARFQMSGTGTLTVTNPIVLMGGEMLYNASGYFNCARVPRRRRAGLGVAPYGYAATGGTVTGYSGTSYLNVVNDSSGSLVVNNGATVALGDSTNFSAVVTAIFGSTTVNSGGTLTSGISGSTLNSPVSLSGTLAGTLNIAGAVTATNTGIIAPGSAATGSTHTVGTIAITGSNTLTLVSGSQLNFNLGANTAAGTSYDTMTVGGAAGWAGRR